MIAPPGRKWIIVLTLPSGSKLVCGGYEGKFALLPVNKNEKEVRLKNVLAWEDSKEAGEWMKNLIEKMSEDQKQGFLKMKPDLDLIYVAQ